MKKPPPKTIPEKEKRPFLGYVYSDLAGEKKQVQREKPYVWRAPLPRIKDEKTTG